MTAHPRTTGRGTPGGFHVAVAARAFATLSNEHRLRILLLLDEYGPARVSTIATALGLRVPHTSQQLGRLVQVGMVRAVGPGTYAVEEHPIWEAVRAHVPARESGTAG